MIERNIIQDSNYCFNSLAIRLRTLNTLSQVTRITGLAFMNGRLATIIKFDHNILYSSLMKHVLNQACFVLFQTVFVIFYMIFAPLFGYLGDRYNRKVILCIGLSNWCFATFAGSFATNFWVFLFFRAVVRLTNLAIFKAISDNF